MFTKKILSALFALTLIAATFAGYTAYAGSHAKPFKTAKPAQAKAQYITKAQAKEIALEHAGVQESAAAFTKAELEEDDGHKEYELEFFSAGYEYEYEINAKSGKILSCEIERDDDDDHDDDDHDDDHDDDDEEYND